MMGISNPLAKKPGPYLLTFSCLPHLTIDPLFSGAETQIIENPTGLEARLASNLQKKFSVKGDLGYYRSCHLVRSGV